MKPVRASLHTASAVLHTVLMLDEQSSQAQNVLHTAKPCFINDLASADGADFTLRFAYTAQRRLFR